MRKHWGKRGGIKQRLCWSSLPGILLADAQALDNKLDDLWARISFQWDVRNCDVFCFTQTWLNPGIQSSARLFCLSDRTDVWREKRRKEVLYGESPDQDILSIFLHKSFITVVYIRPQESPDMNWSQATDSDAALVLLATLEKVMPDPYSRRGWPSRWGQSI